VEKVLFSSPSLVEDTTIERALNWAMKKRLKCYKRQDVGGCLKGAQK
jgi:hypothetical protein